MHYVFGLDAGFLMPTGVAIASLQRFLDPDDVVAALHVGLGDDDVASLRRCAKDVPLLAIDCAPHLHPTWRPAGRLPATAYCRWLAERLLPDADRCVYFDGDVLVRRNPRTFAETDLDGRTVGAVRSRVAPFLASPGGVKAWFELGLRGAAPFFNTGVLVMDLAAWRERDVTARLVGFTSDDRDTWVETPVNEAMNAVLCEDWTEVGREWNYITHVTESFLPAPEDEPADPAVVHFAGTHKPWTCGRLPIYADEWYEVLASTPWVGFRPEPPASPTGLRAGARRLAGRGLRRLRAAARDLG